MKLTKIDDNGNVTGITDEFRSMPEFRTIWTLEYNKGKGDHDGRKRDRAKAELLYVEYMYNPKTPYRDYSEKDREEQARLDTGLTGDWEPSKELLSVIKKYKDSVTTRFYKLLTAAENAIDKIRNYLDTVDLTKETSSGNLVNHPTDVIKVLSDLPKLATALKALQEQAKYDLVSSSKTKGDHEVGWMAIKDGEDG